MSSSAASKNAILRDAFTSTATKEKGPPAADGILSITPDAPDVAEWRRNALDVAETTSTYLDDDDDGPKPNELYGKFTWKIENFSEISKRELRSNVFDVGNYKWYILVYPQGCDVCNHLSLFLCVADYDKLLPGWSHFAQFTIAVVNKDPKKSKYSDTLHRFCKKEHDWGWKKFMELSKVLDGFTTNDTLVIKAQVQVILDKPSRPFRCLDPQYRRELVRVYLTNVEGVCRRFCEDKKAKLGWVRDEIDRFKDFWLGLSKEAQRKLLADRADGILKGLVKQFFNEKEVTSTLVMDALFSGLKQAEEHSRSYSEGKGAGPDGPPLVLIKAERNTFSLHGDLLEVAERVNKDFIPAPKDEKPLIAPNDGLTLRSGQEDDYRRDSIERDEKRLAELGRKTVEMFAIGYIITERMEVAYRDAEALKRQDQLIAEEFETQKLEESKAKAQAEKEKEKKAKKKEKVKAKKDAERAKKEEEEAEKKKLEDAKRLEQERKAQEAAAEKKRQEDELAKTRQQVAAKQAAVSKQASASSSAEGGKNKQVVAGTSAKASPPGSGEKPSSISSQAANLSRQALSSLDSSLELGTEGFEDAESMSGGGAGGPESEQEDLDEAGVSLDVTGGGNSNEVTRSGGSSAPGSTLGTQAASFANGNNINEEEEEEEEEDDDEEEEEEGADEMSDHASAAYRSSIGRISADDFGAMPSSADRGSVSVLLSTNALLEQEVASLKSKVASLEKQLSDRDAEISSLQARVAEMHQSTAQARVQSKQMFMREPSNPSNPGMTAAGAKAKDGLMNGIKEAAPPPPPPPPPAAPPQNASARRLPGQFDLNPVSATSASVAASAAVHGRASVPPAAPPPLPLPQQQQQMRTTSLGGPSSFMTPSNPLHQNGRPTRANDTSAAASVAVASAAAAAAVSGGRPSLSAPSQPQTTASAAAHQFAANQQAAAAAAAAGLLQQHPPGTSNDAMGVAMGLGLPSYRNAAAGVVLGSAAANTPSNHHNNLQQQQSGGQVAQTRTSTTSITPPATPKSNPGGANEGGSATGSSAGGHLSHTATEFSANHRLVMQQQASYGQQQQAANAKRAMQAHPMDSPGLDDFAHMGLIDDLLTE